MLNPFSTAAKLVRTESLANQLQKEINTMNKTNWKTNTFGIAAVVFAIAIMWAPPQYVQKLKETQAQMAILAGLVGGGLIAAKDGNK